MVTFFQTNAWWFLPLVMYPIKILIEICVGVILPGERTLAIRRIGLEFCFLSLGFYALALVFESSKFYGEWREIQGIAAFISFAFLLILYVGAVLIYKYRGEEIGLWPFRKLKWLFPASVVGVFALVVSLLLF